MTAKFFTCCHFAFSEISTMHVKFDLVACEVWHIDAALASNLIVIFYS